MSNISKISQINQKKKQKILKITLLYNIPQQLFTKTLQKYYRKIKKNRMRYQKNPRIQMGNLCNRIINMYQTGKNDRISQQLTQLCKVLVWGDRNDSQLFKYIIEIKILDKMLEIFRKTNSKEVVIAIISFFSSLISNINKNQNVRYLLEHPCLISLENIKFFSLDNQIAEYYINFLHTIAQKIEINSLYIFFNQRYPTFPLLMQATRFYNHPESLVRTKTRSILLSCLRINSTKIKEFAVGFPFVIYYIHQCNLLREYWLIINQVVELEGDKQFELQNLEGVLEDQNQLVMIFDDFMKIHPIAIAQCFINAFANQCMPSVLQALYESKKVTFSLKVVLLIASILITNIHNQQFTDFLIFCFFGKYYTSTLCVKLMHPVEKPLSYSKKWKFKGFWDSYQTNISQYCSDVYFPNQQLYRTVSCPSINNSRKLQKNEKKYTKQMRSIFGMGTNFYQREVQKIEQIFAIPINSDPQTFQRKCVSSLLSQFKKKIKEGNLDINKLEDNPVRQQLLCFLKSKDDALVMLILTLLRNVINNKIASPQILDLAGLSTHPLTPDFTTTDDLQQIIKCCYGIMQFQPPTFRLCTYREAAYLIQTLQEIYGEGRKIPDDVVDGAKQALRQSIERLDSYIYAGKEWEQSINIFNKVSIYNSKNRRKDLYTYGFLERERTELNGQITSQLFDSYPKTKQQVEVRDFWLYIIIRDSFCKLMKLSLKYNLANCDEKQQQKAETFEIGSYYDIPKDHKVQVNYKQITNKIQIYSQCSLIFLTGYFIIGQNSTVKYKSSYEDCQMKIDKNNANVLIVDINKKILEIQVENAKQANQLKKYFVEMKTLMFKYQLSLLVKQTEWLLDEAKITKQSNIRQKLET